MLLNIDPQSWPALSELLDEWLDLPEDSRAGWLDRIPDEHVHFVPVLQELIAQFDGDRERFLATVPRLYSSPESDYSFAEGMYVGVYRLVRELGHGGMGVVWLAERDDAALKRTVALKLPAIALQRRGLAERFVRERDILSRLTHSQIARLYDAGVADGGQPYLAMEYVDGEHITAYCDQRRLPVARRLQLFLNVLAAVQYAHANLIVHRDLKPSNILVSREGEVRLLDFGIAKLLTEGEEAETELTGAGGPPMTPDYASPEQMTGARITTASDVYSLGIVLYELLTGERPYRLYRGAREVEALFAAGIVYPSRAISNPSKAQARSCTVKRLRNTLKGDLDWVVLKAIEKEPGRRYTTADSFAADIRRFLAGEPVLAHKQSAWNRARKFVTRNRLAVGSAAAVFAALSIGLGAAMWQTHTARLEKQRADTQAATAAAVTDFIQNDLLLRASPYTAGPSDPPEPDLKLRTAVDRAASRIAGKFANQPLVEASIRRTIGDVYSDLGLYSDAQTQVQIAIDLRRRVLGAAHRETLSSTYALAELYRSQGKYADAESLDREVLAIQTRLFGERDLDTLKTMSSLASAVGWQRKFAESESIYARLLSLSRQALGDENPLTLSAMNDVAPVYQGDRKYSKAFDSLQQALTIERRVLGEDHPNTIETIYNLGAISLYYGKAAEALPLLTRARDSWGRTLPADHPYAILSRGILGTYAFYIGRYKDAEAINTEMLAVRRRVFGDDHANTLGTLVSLGQVKADLGSYAEGERLVKEVLAAQQRLHRTPVSMLRPSAALGYIYLRAGKLAQAEDVLKSTIERQRKMLGEDHADTLLSLNQLGELYAAAGKEREAADVTNHAIELWRRTVAPEHVFLADAETTLARLHVRRQRYSEAEWLLRQALFAYERASSESWRRYEAQALLGIALVSRGKGQEARRYLISGRRGLLERKAIVPVYARATLAVAEH